MNRNTSPKTSPLPAHWQGRRYYSLDAWFKQTYGFNVYKIAIDAGFTCPTRDGTLGSRGCIFCSAQGSGDFAIQEKTLEQQLSSGLTYWKSRKANHRFFAYFQAYTNTYGSVELLEQLYQTALSHPDILGISIATRPDCLPPQVLVLLRSLKERFPAKAIWIELGLQTIHEDTAVYIRRGYSLSCYDEAMTALHKIGIPVIVHLILGLPGEGREKLLQTISYINQSNPFGIKLQLLHILEGTDLANEYRSGKVTPLSKEDYLALLSSCLSYLSPDIVIHRLTGDGPKNLILAPLWSLHKRDVLNTFHHLLKEKNLYQGKLYGQDPSLTAPFPIRQKI